MPSVTFPACDEEAERHSRVQVAARNVTEGIDHRQHDQAEDESNADMGHRAAAHVVDDNSSGPGEYQSERAEHLRSQPSHSFGPQSSHDLVLSRVRSLTSSMRHK